MFRSGVISYVLHVRINGEKTGSAFLYPYRGKSFLVTARHVLLGEEIEKFDLFQKGSWIDVTADIGFAIFPDNEEVDIGAVRVPDAIDIDKMAEVITFGEGVTFLGDDAYFIGYPYGLSYSHEVDTDDGRMLATFPLIKKACVSGAHMDSTGTNIGFFLDGHNNPGFSGGPCIAKKHEQSEDRWNIFGVMTSYYPELRQFDVNGKPKTILENSGICICHSFGHIKSAIKSAYKSV